jgi:ATP-dependent DNA helicase RecG
MTPAELAQRLRLGEDSRTEFKSVVRSGHLLDADALAKTIVAFANSGGGQVFVGVDDDGAASGIGTVQQADALMRQVTQTCRDKIHPPISCSLIKSAAESRAVLVVDVPGFGPDRPYRAGNVYYVREANRNREAARDELIRLLESIDYHFDEDPIAGATTEALDMNAAREFLATTYQPGLDERQLLPYLRALKCLAPGADVPTVSGMLFFGREPQQWMRDALISAVRVPGIQASLEVADRQLIGGRLAQQIDGARAFLDRHRRRPQRVEGWERREHGIPDEVLREAVLNALTHRDYRASAQVGVIVYDDRVEIVNPGGLLNRLTLDSIRLGGISQRRNPVVASLLARMHRRENLGFGVPEMYRLMRERGLPEPEISVTGGHFRVVLRNGP